MSNTLNFLALRIAKAQGIHIYPCAASFLFAACTNLLEPTEVIDASSEKKLATDKLNLCHSNEN